MSFPKIQGISRMADNEFALLLSPARRLTDDEMRAVHDYLNDPYLKSEFELRGRSRHANQN